MTDSSPTVPAPPPARSSASSASASGAAAESMPVFRRLLSMLRPYRGRIIVALVLLLMSVPCELFPAIAWGYITDDIVLQKQRSPLMTRWFSFNGQITTRLGLLFSSVAWMFAIYLCGELFGTIQQWTMNRVAQRF